MKSFISFLLFLSLISASLCPNMCNGHGTCSKSGTCLCGPGYSSGDCSERTCPYGETYVDPTIYATGTPEPKDTRIELECSAQGECDRINGLCVCHAGYEGNACQRLSCPNGCSGHGVCTAVRYLESEDGVYLPSNPEDYKGWDGEESHVCYCDEEYEGYDCSMKKCNFGYMATSDCDDPVDGNTQTISFTLNNKEDKLHKLGYLNYTDPFYRVWYSDAFDLTHRNTANKDDTGKKPVKGWWDILNSFPPGVLSVDKVEIYDKDGNVVAETTPYTTVQVKITYSSHQTGRQGDNIEIIMPKDIKYPGLTTTPSAIYGATATEVADATMADGAKISITNPSIPKPTMCANNGICNRATGLCDCFKGFYGLSCTEQSDSF